MDKLKIAIFIIDIVWVRIINPSALGGSVYHGDCVGAVEADEGNYDDRKANVGGQGGMRNSLRVCICGHGGVLHRRNHLLDDLHPDAKLSAVLVQDAHLGTVSSLTTV